MKRDAFNDPRVGDVFVNRGVRREIIGRTDGFVRSRFSSPRWKHTEWAPVATFRKWVSGGELVQIEGKVCRIWAHHGLDKAELIAELNRRFESEAGA